MLQKGGGAIIPEKFIPGHRVVQNPAEAQDIPQHLMPVSAACIKD
jgi:hypothetical protein